MSLADITLNARVYSVRSVTGSRVLRACTVATLPSNAVDNTLEISHEFSTTKSNRSLIKFSRTVLDSDNVPVPISLHAVLTVPKGLAPASITGQTSGTGGMGDDLADLLGLDTFAFLTRMMNGEFS